MENKKLSSEDFDKVEPAKPAILKLWDRLTEVRPFSFKDTEKKEFIRKP